MADTLKNFTGLATTSMADVYTAPSGASVVVMGCQVANLTGADTLVTVVVSDSSNSNAEYEIVKDFPIPPNSAVGIVDGRLVLESLDKIRFKSSVASSVRILGSVMESV